MGIFGELKAEIIVEKAINLLSKEDQAGIHFNEISALTRDFCRAILSDLEQSSFTTSELEKEIADKVKIMFAQGYHIEVLQLILEKILDSFISVIREQYHDLQAAASYITTVRDHIFKGTSFLLKMALQTQREVIQKQNEALMELSTPVIPLMQDILLLPLIGTIDTRRAKEIMDNLLEGIVRYQAEVVIIDISGVPVVDTQVAHHLIKTVKAARLLGSRCILVGIRPELAQTIVRLGIDFPDIITKNNLHAGLELAFRWLGYRLERVEHDHE
ncbi:STAS domain-containing protein [Neomoorella thermoacetica]|uniref:STAS domain-containing protein n=1 Tax=Neomoorella thermoacetica TaxID=1525 RepID=UPI0008FA527A|nr:STAS domain-containing protein [Moorella thermoacetica]OIQ11071.1 RsbT co-antagonist protein RsbRA [Moorella thermoacetica]OIQ60143.1 RsbT co-antagonist protein RsbRA [Moorella thermoacetica]